MDPSTQPGDGPGSGREPRPGAPPERARVYRGMLLLAAAIFAAEQLLPFGVAVGGLYILPVLLSLWLGDRRTTITVAAVCTLLTCAGLVFFGPESSLLFAIANRAVVVFVLWLTAGLGLLRIRIESELEESRETTATTLRSIADAVITTDATGRVTFLNAVAESLTGWRSGDALGQPLERVFQRRRRASDDAQVAEGAPGEPEPADTLPASGELAIVTRSGKRIPIEASTALIRETRAAGPGSAASRGRVLVFRDITERHRYQKTVEELAYRDSLTGLHNRASFLDRLGLELAHARRRDEPLALLFLDLDGFKGVNDELGHHAGDVLLVQVAQRLRECLREGDTVARLGGDEFTIVLPRVSAPDDARQVAEKLVQRLLEPHSINGREVIAAPSLGIALYPRDAANQEELLQRADQAMYRAKELGGGRAFDRTQGSPAHAIERSGRRAR